MALQLSYPAETKGEIVSKFGSRWNEYTKTYQDHYGVDIGIVSGTSVLSIADGEVIRSDMYDVDGLGNFILIKHNILGKEVYSGYAHLLKRLVKIGDKVTKGQKIGLSGGNQGKELGGGDSSGQHLHFEIRNKVDGDFIDPEIYLKGSDILDKTTEKAKEKFDEIKKDVKEIDVKKLREELKQKLEDLDFKEKLAEKLNVDPSEIDKKIEEDGFLKTAVITGTKILEDNAPEIWTMATKIWEKINDIFNSIKTSETAKLISSKFADVEKKYEASDKGMWEQNERLKKIIKKIL